MVTNITHRAHIITHGNFVLVEKWLITLQCHCLDCISDGVFHRLIALAVRWSQDQGGCRPSLHCRHASLYADDLHQIELLMSSPRQTKIKVGIESVSYQESPWRHWASRRMNASRRIISQSQGSFLNMWENIIQVVCAITSDILRIMYWRHGRSWIETKYRVPTHLHFDYLDSIQRLYAEQITSILSLRIWYRIDVLMAASTVIEYIRISLGRDKNKWGKWNLLLISWCAPDKVWYQSLKFDCKSYITPFSSCSITIWHC